MIERLVEGQVPFAMSKTMNQALSSAKKAVIGSMNKEIEGGATRFTKTGMKVYWTKKRNLNGSIVFKSDRDYMQEIMHGGNKKARNKKLPEPVIAQAKNKSELNKFGNVPRSLYKRASDKADKKYFMGIPRGRPKSDRYRGIWRRQGKPGYYKNGKARGRINMVVSFERRERYQNPTFRAPEIAQKAYEKAMLRKFRKNLRDAVGSARGFRRV